MSDQFEDHRIEAYLRSFRPLEPDPLPRSSRGWWLVPLAGIAATLAMLLIPQFHRSPAASIEPRRLTIGSANRRLVNSSSWNLLLEDVDLVSRPASRSALTRRGSVLEFLSQEDLSQ